jgi:glyoxylase-like metal-dependent hydrolase (beta-lactamase superfamily II)
MNHLCLIIGDNIQFEVPPVNLAQLNKSIKLILRKKPTKIYCTHGGPFDPKAVLRRF